jgi:hypothetical protein
MGDIYFKFRQKRYCIRRFSIIGAIITVSQIFIIMLAMVMPFITIAFVA